MSITLYYEMTERKKSPRSVNTERQDPSAGSSSLHQIAYVIRFRPQPLADLPTPRTQHPTSRPSSLWSAAGDGALPSRCRPIPAIAMALASQPTHRGRLTVQLPPPARLGPSRVGTGRKSGRARTASNRHAGRCTPLPYAGEDGDTPRPLRPEATRPGELPWAGAALTCANGPLASALVRRCPSALSRS